MSEVIFVDFKKKQVDRVEVRPDKKKPEPAVICSDVPETFPSVAVISGNTLMPAEEPRPCSITVYGPNASKELQKILDIIQEADSQPKKE